MAPSGRAGCRSRGSNPLRPRHLTAALRCFLIHGLTSPANTLPLETTRGGASLVRPDWGTAAPAGHRLVSGLLVCPAAKVHLDSHPRTGENAPRQCPIVAFDLGALGGDSGSLAVTTSPGDPGSAQTEGGRVRWKGGLRGRTGSACLPPCQGRDMHQGSSGRWGRARGGGTLSAPACSLSLLRMCEDFFKRKQ